MPNGRVARILWAVWFALCVAALIHAFTHQDMRDMPVAFAWHMIYLTAPTGVALIWALGLLELWGDPSWLLVCWLLAVGVGHLQWFVAAPMLFRKSSRASGI
jgi:hypothetical protein